MVGGTVFEMWLGGLRAHRRARPASPFHYYSALYSGRMADSYKTAESP